MKSQALFVLLTLWAASMAGSVRGFQNTAAPQAAAKATPKSARVIFLHHSTGECIWNSGAPAWFEAYNRQHGVKYSVRQQAFPKESPYGWENFPYDYWNIWVKHAGAKKYREEPTLEILAPQYDVIVLKHCFPVSSLEADTGRADIESSEKRQENYKLQYAALKRKMREFPKVKFVVWTGAALLQSETNPESAGRAKAFFDWVLEDWDEKGDNIFLWDFRELETEGGLYMNPNFAAGDSHPNEEFSKRVAPLFGQRIVDVIEGRGDSGSLTGGRLAAPTGTTRSEVSGITPLTKSPATVARTKSQESDPRVLEDAEVPSRRALLWGDSAKYEKEGDGQIVRLLFSAAEEEDWSDYGKQRVIFTKPLTKNLDLRPYRYLSMRMKADRELEVMLSIVTLPDPGGPRDQPHVKFSAYLRPTKGGWKTLTVDLPRLELGVEGEGALEKAGSPERPNDLTMLKFSVGSKYGKFDLLMDDLVLHEILPEKLKNTVQEP